MIYNIIENYDFKNLEEEKQTKAMFMLQTVSPERPIFTEFKKKFNLKKKKTLMFLK